MGVGRASGKDKAEEAAKMAITSPLLETSIQGSKGIIINISASPDITLDAVDAASSIISETADPDANIIFGVALDSSLDDEMIVTVVATGFGGDGAKKEVKEAAKAEAETASQEAVKEEPVPQFGTDDDDVSDIFDLFKSRK